MVRAKLYIILILLLSGCAPLTYKVAGNTADDIGSNLIMPYLLKTDDMVTACSAGESLPVMVLPLEVYQSDIKKMSILTYMINGFCANRRAAEFALESAAHIFRGEPSGAKDALIRSRRWHTLSARRFYHSYMALVSVYPDYGMHCSDLGGEKEEFLWLVGALAAMQALLNNFLGGEQVEIPKTIVRKSERALACLDQPDKNMAWWGLPQALRASLWVAIPGLAPPQSEPWDVLNDAVAIGNESGVRMAHALLAISLDNASNTLALKEFIGLYAGFATTFNVDPDWRLLDAFAAEMVLSLSDQLWMEARGHRTPQRRLGSFWDDKMDVYEDFGSLVEGL